MLQKISTNTQLSNNNKDVLLQALATNASNDQANRVALQQLIDANTTNDQMIEGLVRQNIEDLYNHMLITNQNYNRIQQNFDDISTVWNNTELNREEIILNMDAINLNYEDILINRDDINKNKDNIIANTQQDADNKSNLEATISTNLSNIITNKSNLEAAISTNLANIIANTQQDANDKSELEAAISTNFSAITENAINKVNRDLIISLLSRINRRLYGENSHLYVNLEKDYMYNLTFSLEFADDWGDGWDSPVTIYNDNTDELLAGPIEPIQVSQSAPGAGSTNYTDSEEFSLPLDTRIRLEWENLIYSNEVIVKITNKKNNNIWRFEPFRDTPDFGTVGDGFTYTFSLMDIADDTEIALSVPPQTLVDTAQNLVDTVNEVSILRNNVNQLFSEIYNKIYLSGLKLILNDSYGDGWNGTKIRITAEDINQTEIVLYEDITLDNYCQQSEIDGEQCTTADVEIDLPTGKDYIIKFETTYGDYTAEVSWSLVDSTGTILIDHPAENRETTSVYELEYPLKRVKFEDYVKSSDLKLLFNVLPFNTDTNRVEEEFYNNTLSEAKNLINKYSILNLLNGVMSGYYPTEDLIYILQRQGNYNYEDSTVELTLLQCFDILEEYYSPEYLQSNKLMDIFNVLQEGGSLRSFGTPSIIETQSSFAPIFGTDFIDILDNNNIIPYNDDTSRYIVKYLTNDESYGPYTNKHLHSFLRFIYATPAFQNYEVIPYITSWESRGRSKMLQYLFFYTLGLNDGSSWIINLDDTIVTDYKLSNTGRNNILNNLDISNIDTSSELWAWLFEEYKSLNKNDIMRIKTYNHSFENSLDYPTLFKAFPKTEELFNQGILIINSVNCQDLLDIGKEYKVTSYPGSIIKFGSFEINDSNGDTKEYHVMKNMGTSISYSTNDYYQMDTHNPYCLSRRSEYGNTIYTLQFEMRDGELFGKEFATLVTGSDTFTYTIWENYMTELIRVNCQELLDNKKEYTIDSRPLSLVQFGNFPNPNLLDVNSDITFSLAFADSYGDGWDSSVTIYNNNTDEKLAEDIFPPSNVTDYTDPFINTLPVDTIIKLQWGSLSWPDEVKVKITYENNTYEFTPFADTPNFGTVGNGDYSYTFSLMDLVGGNGPEVYQVRVNLTGDGTNYYYTMDDTNDPYCLSRQNGEDVYILQFENDHGKIFARESTINDTEIWSGFLNELTSVNCQELVESGKIYKADSYDYSIIKFENSIEDSTTQVLVSLGPQSDFWYYTMDTNNPYCLSRDGQYELRFKNDNGRMIAREIDGNDKDSIMWTSYLSETANINCQELVYHEKQYAIDSYPLSIIKFGNFAVEDKEYQVHVYRGEEYGNQFYTIDASDPYCVSLRNGDDVYTLRFDDVNGRIFASEQLQTGEVEWDSYLTEFSSINCQELLDKKQIYTIDEYESGVVEFGNFSVDGKEYQLRVNLGSNNNDWYYTLDDTNDPYCLSRYNGEDEYILRFRNKNGQIFARETFDGYSVEWNSYLSEDIGDIFGISDGFFDYQGKQYLKCENYIFEWPAHDTIGTYKGTIYAFVLQSVLKIDSVITCYLDNYPDIIQHNVGGFEAERTYLTTLEINYQWDVVFFNTSANAALTYVQEQVDAAFGDSKFDVADTFNLTVSGEEVSGGLEIMISDTNNNDNDNDNDKVIKIAFHVLRDDGSDWTTEDNNKLMDQFNQLQNSLGSESKTDESLYDSSNSNYTSGNKSSNLHFVLDKKSDDLNYKNYFKDLNDFNNSSTTIINNEQYNSWLNSNDILFPENSDAQALSEYIKNIDGTSLNYGDTINVYCTNPSESNGILGYATLPQLICSLDGNTLGGTPCWGIWMTLNNINLYPNLLAHEVGHSLGLNHTWGPSLTDNSESDNIDDTTSHSEPNYFNPNILNSDGTQKTRQELLNLGYDQDNDNNPDPVHNVMNYSDQNNITDNQLSKINSVINNYLPEISNSIPENITSSRTLNNDSSYMTTNYFIQRHGRCCHIGRKMKQNIMMPNVTKSNILQKP